MLLIIYLPLPYHPCYKLLPSKGFSRTYINLFATYYLTETVNQAPEIKQVNTRVLARHISINSPAIIHSNVEGQVIIVNLAAGIYYHLENIGAAVWNFLSSNPTFEELVQSFSEKSGTSRAEAEAAISQFLSKLREEGLIICEATAIPNAMLSAASGVVEKATGAMFASLRVNKFTDLMKLGGYAKL